MDSNPWMIISLFALLLSALIRPTTLHAPPGWYFEGVRPDGNTTMRKDPPPNCGEPTGPYQQPCPNDSRSVGMRLDCTNGTQPILVHDRTVGCQRGGWK